jgi:hypothetical protein
MDNNNKLHVKQENNLIYVDPNRVVVDGQIIPRVVEHEKLVMYVNLEADIIPRTTLCSNENKGERTSIAQGRLNFLKNQNGKDYDTSWTESYFQRSGSDGNGLISDEGEFSDNSGQSFGMKSINIVVKGGNFIPQITMEFIDVRGKTLLESPKDSPYNAFFHLPWPIFYLTIKGYYGKAIKYRLHMIKFRSKFNGVTGNFEISTTFVGSTYAYLNDITLSGILNAPYMFQKERVEYRKKNENKTTSEQHLTKSTRGYQILRSVYSELKAKKLIPRDFPVITLRELGEKCLTYEKIIQDEIFGKVIDPKVILGLQNYTKIVKDMRFSFDSWFNINLDPAEVLPSPIKNKRYFRVKEGKIPSKLIFGDEGTLENLITKYNRELKGSSQFTNINQDAKSKKFDDDFLTKTLSSTRNYVHHEYINKEQILSDIYEIEKTLTIKTNTLYKDLERELNQIVRSKKNGIGFDPTIRNIFAIFLANADVLIRLLKESHVKSFDVRDERKKLLLGTDLETDGESIYAWPQISKKERESGTNVIAYPGDPELREQLHTSNKRLWPEIDFIEEFVKVSTLKSDPSNIEGGRGSVDNKFPDDVVTMVSTLFTITDIVPYTERTVSSVIYEMYERAKILTFVDSFDTTIIGELVDIESSKIIDMLMEEDEIRRTLSLQMNSTNKFIQKLHEYSEFNRALYLNDSIPTTKYLSDVIESPFSISSPNYDMSTNGSPFLNSHTASDIGGYENINSQLVNYTPEKYRKDVYPFSSNVYLKYINKNTFDEGELRINRVVNIDMVNGFISTPTNAKMWVKTEDVFSQNFKIGGNTTNILNTPIFHNQIYSDFQRLETRGKYAGSSYLLLNSLPFYDLDDVFDVSENKEKNTDLYRIRMSSMFKEIGASHYIPYFLILKWGSLYHRYKKYIIENTDIISGCTINNITRSVDEHLFFNNGTTDNYTVNGVEISHETQNYVGFHPYYDAIFHQVVNGYHHYDITDSSSFGNNILNNAVLYEKEVDNAEIGFWTFVVDNSMFNSTDLRYTILPTNSDNKKFNDSSIYGDSTTTKKQSGYRMIIEDEVVCGRYDEHKFPSYNEYNRTFNEDNRKDDNIYGIGENYRKFVDLIGTFSPQILEKFEELFIDFSTEVMDVETPFKMFENIQIDKFQTILKEICTVEKNKSITNVTSIINDIRTKQRDKLTSISRVITNNDSLVKVTIGNPKEIIPYVFEGFTKFAPNSSFTYPPFNGIKNEDYVKVYIGEDIDGFYLDFFQICNVEMSVDNILQFRPMVLIYAGYRKKGGTNTKNDFIQYLTKEILEKSSNRFNLFLTRLISKITSIKVVEGDDVGVEYQDGVNMNELKLDLYSFFKSFNDKWTSGNSIGEKLLLEEFLFLDKANRDIGNRAYVSIDKIKDVLIPENSKINLYSVISILLKGSGFDMRALPAYVNFYGNSSLDVKSAERSADDIFGIFDSVDYVESSPKIVIQYVDVASRHLENSTNNSMNKYQNDGFDISETTNNKMLITSSKPISNEELQLSNKVVAFEVNFGDIQQNIFKDIQIDQDSIRNTSEAYVLMELLASKASGTGAHATDTSLFDLYRQHSYTCEVRCMGNVMIQPTMFFNLNNIPMFRGTYWITEVSHGIADGNISTIFKGVRLNKMSMPKIEDTFITTFRSLLQKIQENAMAVVKTDELNTADESKSEQDKVKKITKNEVDKNEVKVLTKNDNNLIDINRVRINGDYYYEAIVAIMGGDKYPIKDNTVMSVFEDPRLTWGKFKTITNECEFYSTRIETIYGNFKYTTIENGSTQFYNPNTKKHKLIKHEYGGVNETTMMVSGLINNGPGQPFPYNNKTNISNGLQPKASSYGIGLSIKLMRSLKIKEGDTIYFRITK